MDMRELKGLEIAARSQVIFKDGAWLVPSQTTSNRYKVYLTPNGDTCECEDFQLTLVLLQSELEFRLGLS